MVCFLAKSLKKTFKDATTALYICYSNDNNFTMINIQKSNNKVFISLDNYIQKKILA